MIIRGLGLIFILASIAPAQHRGPFWSIGGFGNVLFPGTGHAPPSQAGGITGPVSFPTSFGGNHGETRNTVVVVGGQFLAGSPGGDDGDAGQRSGPESEGGQSPATGADESPPTSPSIIDQELIGGQQDPESGSGSQSSCEARFDHSAGEADLAQMTNKGNQLNAGAPTIYLLALRDGSLLQALGYWIRDSILYYVSTDYALNQISLILIDENASERVNEERGLSFDSIPTK